MNPEQLQTPQSKSLVYMAIGGVLVILVMVILFATLRNHTALDITSYIPDDITVTVDGKKVKSTGKVGVEPGQHTVEAKRSGFASQKIDVELKKNETRVIDLSMIPSSDEGYRWLREHPKIVQDLEAKTGKAYDKAAQESAKINPLTKKLPMLRRDWRIDYGVSKKDPTNPEAVAITVTYINDEAKQQALKWIRDQGFDPKDYEIVYNQIQ